MEFLLDNDLRHPIQSGLVWPRWGSFLSFGHWLFLMLAVRKPFSFPKVVRCLDKLWDLVLSKMVLT